MTQVLFEKYVGTKLLLFGKICKFVHVMWQLVFSLIIYFKPNTLFEVNVTTRICIYQNKAIIVQVVNNLALSGHADLSNKTQEKKKKNIPSL